MFLCIIIKQYTSKLVNKNNTKIQYIQKKYIKTYVNLK